MIIFQIGSGKTHTMLGDIEDLDVTSSLHGGMTLRIFELLSELVT